MLQILAKRIADRIRGEYALDFPVEALVELIMWIISQCFLQSRLFVSSAKAPTIAQRAALNIAIRRVMDIRGRDRILAVQQVVLAKAASATDDELLACHQEAVQELGLDYDHSPVA